VGLNEQWRKFSHNKKVKRVKELGLPERIGVAKSPFTNPDLLFELAKDRSPQVRQVVAGNSSINSEVIKLLAHDVNSMVRTIIAKRFDLNEKFVDKLSLDESEDVLIAVALREKLSFDQQTILSNSGSRVKQKLAIRKDLEFSVAVKLSNDEDPRVRVILAAMTPFEQILTQLENDKNYEVQKIVAKRKGNYNSQDVKWQKLDHSLRKQSKIDRDRWMRILSNEIFKNDFNNRDSA
jgi:hypothetical protein